MALFNKLQKQMVLDLIISENPGLVGATLNNVEFVGVPVVLSGASTQAKLRGKRGSGFTGVKAVTYNRLHLGTLFTNVTLRAQVYNATTSLDLIPAINDRYGLNLNAAEMVSFAIANGATSANVSISVSSSPGSFVYYGAATCAWTKGNLQLTDYYPNRTLNSVTTPDVMLKAYQLDFSDTLTTLQAHNTTVAFSSASSTAQAIVGALKTKVGLPLTLSATTTPGTDPYDLAGYTLSFTTADVIQDSSPLFRNVAVLTPPVAYGNQYAPIYLHYNRVPLFVKTKTADVVTVTEMGGLQAPSQ
jgi:hypothetical protein